MDARSQIDSALEKNNRVIEDKLGIIRNLMLHDHPLKAEDSSTLTFAQSEYEKHRHLSLSFYYSLMLAYRDLVAETMLNALATPQSDPSEQEALERKYRRFREAITHRLTHLQLLMDGQAAHLHEKKQSSQRGRDYQAIVSVFREALAVDQVQSPEWFLNHVQLINVAFMKMNFIFLKDKWDKDVEFEAEKSDAMLLLIKQQLSIVTAVDFIFQLEYLVRGYALGQSVSAVPPSNEFIALQQIFIDGEKADDASPCSLQPFYDELKVMLENNDKETIDSNLDCFKEKIQHYQLLGGGVVSPELKLEFDQKLAELKNRYLDEAGEFSKIKHLAQKIHNDDSGLLSGEESERLGVYAKAVKDFRKFVLAKRPRIDTEKEMDKQIDDVLASFSDTSEAAGAVLTRSRSRSQPEVSPSSVSASPIARDRLQSQLGVANQAKTSIPPVVPSALRQSMQKAATALYNKPNPANFFTPDIKMPNLAKYLLIGIGIGLLVSVLAASAVALAYFAIHGGAPLLAVAFLGATKVLGGGSLGAWSLVAGVLASPPVVGLLSAMKRWRHACHSLFSPASTATIVNQGTEVNSTTKSASQPASFMRPSRTLPEQKLAGLNLANNPNTIYARKGSNKLVAPPVSEETQVYSSKKKLG
jgi:hypothetical protein